MFIVCASWADAAIASAVSEGAVRLRVGEWLPLGVSGASRHLAVQEDSGRLRDETPLADEAVG